MQGYNVPYCGLVTMGEAWHNNHHAFPGSARLGVNGETDRAGGCCWCSSGWAWRGTSRRPKSCRIGPTFYGLAHHLRLAAAIAEVAAAD